MTGTIFYPIFLFFTILFYKKVVNKLTLSPGIFYSLVQLLILFILKRPSLAFLKSIGNGAETVISSPLNGL